jgi:hypothetical protein
MKKILLLFVIFLPIVISAQYYKERTTEHNFEKSDLFFQSHYLNPFGMKNIKQLSLSLIDNPFLNAQLNPALMPDTTKGTTYIYLDFRGDRTEAPIVANRIIPAYYDYNYRYIPDYRLISTTREAPEPIVSVGIITYPVSALKNSFYVGGSFQYINSKDKFYSTPFYIYNSMLDARSYNEKVSSVPVVDRYAGQDEMIIKGKLFSAFTGYRLLDNLSLGLSINTVTYDKSGSYLNENNDKYGTQHENEYNNKELRTREQNYSHFDFAAGIMYNLKNDLSFGIKAGILSGDVDQNHLTERAYFYRNNQPEVSQNWWLHSSQNKNTQNWQHNGNTKYLGFNFSKQLAKSTVKGYYKYSSAKINTSTVSAIFDTSYSSSRWVSNYDTTFYLQNNHSLTKDDRTGSGIRESTKHEVMINVNWQLNEKTKLLVGFYINSTNSIVQNSESANYKTISYYKSEGSYKNLDDRTTTEDKILTWDYDNDYFTFQIPIILNFKLNDHFGFMLGVTRIFQEWNIKSRTDVYFNERKESINGNINTENNFIERYTMPNDVYTEDYTNVFTKFNVNVSKPLRISLLLDPEFDDTFRIAQWWLSFEARL